MGTPEKPEDVEVTPYRVVRDEAHRRQVVHAAQAKYLEDNLYIDDDAEVEDFREQGEFWVRAWVHVGYDDAAVAVPDNEDDEDDGAGDE